MANVVRVWNGDGLADKCSPCFCAKDKIRDVWQHSTRISTVVQQTIVQ